MVKKLAILVGCNYAGTRSQLYGCINDVTAMRRLLIDSFGFQRHDIVVLTDDSRSAVLPTGAHIRRALGHIVSVAEPGDVLFFYFSGHGTIIPEANDGIDEEAIVPCDHNLITNLDFRRLVDGLPAGACLTIISDSCHSGGLIDQEKEQIGPQIFGNSGVVSSNSYRRQKTIPIDYVRQNLASRSRSRSADVGDQLLELFGTEASARYSGHLLSGNAHARSMGADVGILLSGCQTYETSTDMSPSDGGGISYGAFSHAIQTVMKDHTGREPTNRELVMRARALLRHKGFSQHPCLYCSDRNADARFLQPLRRHR